MAELLESLLRIWSDLLARMSGPYASSFVLQPVMAISLAVRDGVSDTRSSRSPPLRGLLLDPVGRRARAVEGAAAPSRVIVLGVLMEGLCQAAVLQSVHPGEALVVALGLAFVPYVVARGIANRLTRAVMRVALLCLVLGLCASAHAAGPVAQARAERGRSSAEAERWELKPSLSSRSPGSRPARGWTRSIWRGWSAI